MGKQQDDNEDGASGGALERFNARVQQATTDDDPDEPEDTGDTDDDEGPSGRITHDADGEMHVSTRAEKKKERRKLIEEVPHLRQENNALLERIARLEGAQSAMLSTRQPDATNDVDPLDQEFTELQRRNTQAFEVLRAKGTAATAEDKEAYKREVLAIDKAKAVLGGKIAMRDQGVQRVDPSAGIQAMLAADNPDIFGHQQRHQYLAAEFQRLRALGKPDNRATFEMAAAGTREAFGLAPSRKQPTANQKSAYAGAPKGRTASGGGEGGGGTIRMTKEIQAIARAKYPGLSDEDAYVKWAKTVGPRVLAASAKERNGG